MGERGPDLLAVDDPLVAVAHRPGRQPGDVGAGAGLAEHLAPDLLVGRQRPQQAPPLLVGPPRDDRGPAHPDADDVEGPWHAIAVEHLVDDLGQPGRERQPGAVLLRTRRRGVAGLTEADAPFRVVELASKRRDLLVVAGVDCFHPARRQVVA